MSDAPASMCGTPQRSRRTRTGPSSPSSSIVPLVFGSGRRAIRCQAIPTPAAARAIPASPPSIPTPAARFGFIDETLLAGWPILGEPAFGLELREVGVHHHRRGALHLGGNVVPGL